MKVKFWSDLHIDHPNAVRFRPWFKNQKEHDEYMLDTLRDSIGKRTKIILLGDIAVGRKGLEQIKKVIHNVPNLLIMGNHDAERQGIKMRDLVDVYDDVQSLAKQNGGKRGFWLSHVPIHETELRDKFCIHGHIHKAVIRDQRYINVCVDWAKQPVKLEDIVSGKYETYNKYLDEETGETRNIDFC